MKNKSIFIKLLLVLIIVPCFLLAGCFDTQTYITNIVPNSSGGYTVTYDDGTQKDIPNNTIKVNFTIEDLRQAYEAENNPQKSFTEYLMENANITASYNVSIEELKQAWQEDYNNSKTTLSFSEFLASFANLGESYTKVEAVNKALLSVVSIVCEFTYTTNSWSGSNTQTVQGAGSGVIYKLDKANKQAYIITNYHVVYDSEYSNAVSDNIRVCTYGQEDFSKTSTTSIKAQFVGGSEYYDIAVLKITQDSTNSEALFNSISKQATIGNSNDIYLGQYVVAVGNPQAYGISAVEGVISVDSENIEMYDNSNNAIPSREIRTTAPINAGNSGGGLFNEKGALIGIVNAKLVDTDVEGMGYAIPSTTAIAIANNIIDNCDNVANVNVKRVTLGLSIVAKNSKAVLDEVTNLVGIKEDVFVAEKVAGSLCDVEELQIDDKIASIDIKYTSTSQEEHIEVARSHMLTDAILNARVGGYVKLNVVHKDQTTETITLNFTQDCITVIY